MTTYERLIAKAELVKRCVDAIRKGEKVDVVAHDNGIDGTRIYHWLRESGVKVGKRGRPPGHSPEMQYRIHTMAEQRARGDTLEQIAFRAGVSTERVRQLLSEKTH